ncbi:Lipoprotein signal peptidase [Streptococcus sp. DD10]|nr:Lipoprotein signal peptidase [Streptococcus sp. DD10]
MRKFGIPFTILMLTLFDQIFKFWIVANIQLGEIQSFVPGLVSLTYLQNTGAAFSMLENQQWFFIVVTIVVLSGSGYYLYKNRTGSLGLVTALSLVIAGGLGNFIDRLRLGYVVDMFHLDFMNFAIFNLADAYLTIGVLVLFLVIFKDEMNGNKN